MYEYFCYHAARKLHEEAKEKQITAKGHDVARGTLLYCYVTPQQIASVWRRFK
jgi:hypothetical protein